MFARSNDNSEIHYEVTGDADTALVFVHGWLGNVRWWDAQRDAFATSYRVVALDLAGHGQSSRTRTEWTAAAYANDILAVARAVGAPRVVLVGHSMSGAFATLAAPDVPGLVALILVDTLKNLDATPTAEQTAPMFASYRADYRRTVETILPGWLFAPQTPALVRERLTSEFLSVDGDTAAMLLEPLYSFDLCEAARRVRVPVRGIGTDLHPDNTEANRKYFADYSYVDIAGYGHYPMLEAPEKFDAALRAELERL
ncbi:MAG: alpha/beta fold hydrolase [Kofleriaceae bacterium]